MTKKPYDKPSMQVYQIKTSQLICTSPGGDPGWWGEPGGPSQF